MHKENSKSADQTAHMRSLICNFVVCIHQKDNNNRFSCGSYEKGAYHIDVKFIFKHAVQATKLG